MTLGSSIVGVTGRELLILSPTMKGMSLVKSGEYTTAQEDPGLWNLFSIEVGNERPAMAALDYKNRTIEIIDYDKESISLSVAFEVFQDPGFTEGGGNSVYEPRFVASGDVNKDGFSDLIFLVHNKVLIHLGE